MKNSIHPSRTLLLCLLLPVLLLAGCSDQTTPPVVSAGPAPAPANLTPEQKQDYDAAIKRTQPPSASQNGK